MVGCEVSSPLGCGSGKTCIPMSACVCRLLSRSIGLPIAHCLCLCPSPHVSLACPLSTASCLLCACLSVCLPTCTSLFGCQLCIGCDVLGNRLVSQYSPDAHNKKIQPDKYMDVACVCVRVVCLRVCVCASELQTQLPEPTVCQDESEASTRRRAHPSVRLLVAFAFLLDVSVSMWGLLAP